MAVKTTIRISRQRKALIAQYAEAAVNLYGVIRISDFVSLFNSYEEAETTEEEAVPALERYANIEEVEYSLFDNILSGPPYQPDFDDYAANIDDILSQQQGKPRYLPEKELFLRYADVLYFEPTEPYDALKAYILHHKLSPIGEGFDGVDGDLIDLREMIQLGVNVSEYVEYFEDAGYKFKSLDKLNDFLQEVMDTHNNTRLYDNNGFTPNELRTVLTEGEPQSLPANPVRKTAQKIGRNELCPCGSGLKYKNCHGRKLLH